MIEPIGRLFQDAFASAPVAMLIASGDGLIVDVNQQLLRLFGYRRDQLVGQPVERLVDAPEDVHRAKRSEYFAAPKTRPMGAGRDLYGRHRDGHRVPVEIGLTPLVTNEARLVLASVVDLTERRRADEQFRLALEAAPHGILLVDERGLIVRVNAQLETIFGYPRAELIGKPVDLLLPERFRGGHGRVREGFFGQPQARPMGAGRALHGLRKDGSEVPVEIGLAPLQTEQGTLVLCTVVDITERQRAHELLRASLAEKETLLRELHHRAKNNLQLVSSMLNLASARPASEVLAESRDRIVSLALLHEQLYQSGTVANVSVPEYVSTLTQHLRHSWGERGSHAIDFGVQCEALTLPLDQAIPVGLIINELLTNAAKHAFPDGRRGTVTTSVRRAGTRVTVEVSDDGVGLPPRSPAKPGHIGMELVRTLTRQLRAELSLTSTQGTSVSFSFEVQLT